MLAPDPVDLADALARWEAGDLGEPATVAEVDELRADLEAVARAATSAAGDADLARNPIRLTKRRITDLLACERYLVEGEVEGGGADDERRHRGVLVDLLAEHHVLTSRARPDAEALELGVDLCRVLGQEKAATAAWVESLAPDARQAFAEQVTEARDGLLAGWPAFSPRWWARTQEAVQVGLADGDVVLAGRSDVVVGGPPTPWPTLVVEVKSGRFGLEERDDGLVYALLLALRDGRAPAAAITATASRIHVERATADRLHTAAGRVAQAITVAGELARGRAPAARVNRRCDWCLARDRCPEWLAARSAGAAIGT